MRFGAWTPLPHTIRPEPLMSEAMAESATRGLTRGPDKAFRFAVDMVQRAEQLGFETTLIAERWMGTDHSAWLLASALAPLTSRIELMVAVHPGILTPQAVAKLTTSLDRISGGRAALNIVNGWWKEEFETFGQVWWPSDDAARYRRMEEFVQVLCGLWDQDELDFQGEFYRVERQGLPQKAVQVPHPPIYGGTRNPNGKDVIARYCDFWFVDSLTDYRLWEQNLIQAAKLISDMQATAGRYGRRIGFGMSCHVICADTQHAAEELAAQLEEHGKTTRVSFIAAKALGPGLVGTPEIIAERIRRYEAAGVGTFMLHFHPMIEGMERFAREVIPLVSGAADAHCMSRPRHARTAG
ncbi:MAG: LLM class flavin-dependent oxidoreductase [Xanthobacteraceae bacterium]